MFAVNYKKVVIVSENARSIKSMQMSLDHNFLSENAGVTRIRIEEMF